MKLGVFKKFKLDKDVALEFPVLSSFKLVEFKFDGQFLIQYFVCSQRTTQIFSGNSLEPGCGCLFLMKAT